MKRFFLFVAAATMALATEATAQISVDEVTPTTAKPEFGNDMKTSEVESDFYSEAKHRAERLAIRKERNLVDFSANLHGSLTAFSKYWKASGENTITLLANINFLHTYKKGKFTINNTATAKLGYNRTKSNGGWFKNVDEIALSTAPQWDMVKNWTYGANVKFRTQFARGYNGDKLVSSIMSPGYLDASVGFTYTLPLEKFPLKINLAPLAMSATYLSNQMVTERYGVPEGDKSKYEGGFSVQLDFDRTWGKNGWLRYRTTAYSFYGWITDISSKKNFVASETKPKYEHVVPTLRWENTFDIKATKYFSTQLYFQLYYNRAESSHLQVQSMLSVGLTYTFKNK